MIKRIWEDKLLRNSILLFSLNMMASFLNYLCQLLMARVLSIENFGTINVIFSFLLIVSVPGNAITMVVAKKYAETDCVNKRNYNRYLLSHFLKWVSIISIIVLVTELFLFSFIKNVFDIDDNVIILFMIVLGAFSYYHPFFSGVFSGLRKFVFLGSYALLIPVYKLISVVICRNYDDKNLQQLYVILACMILGTLATSIIGWKKSVRSIGGEIDLCQKKEKVVHFRESINTFIVNAMLMIYMNIDLIVVRQLAGERESGMYSSVLLFGRIIYYFSVTIATLILPLTVSEKNTENRSKLLAKALGLQIVFSIFCLIPLNVLGTKFTILLFGSQYESAGMYIKYISLISFALSISTVLANYMVAKGLSGKASKILLLQSILIVCFICFVKKVESLLLLIGGIGLGISILLIVFAFSKEKAKEKVYFKE